MGNFKVISVLTHPKIFIPNLSIESWYDNDFFRSYITSSMAFISGLLLLNFRAIYGRRFQVISTHFNLIKLDKLANITTA